MIAYWRRLSKNETSCKKGQIGMEQAMPYTLDEFCTETRGLLKTEPLSNVLGHIADGLGRLLSNPGFVAETFSDDMPPGRRILHHDPETDFYVLAHVQEGNKTGKPHSRLIMGNLRQCAGIYRNDRMAPHQSGKRAARCPPTGEQVSARAGRDESLWPRRDPFDRAPQEGVGDPRHRYRSRRAPALSFRQARSPARAGLSKPRPAF